MPRPLVEDAGPAWHCGSLQRRCLFIGTRQGRVLVGDRVLEWELVSKPFAVLVGKEKLRQERVRVLLATTSLPSGGRRWWFVCPECLKRRDLLYLLPGGLRLACRQCRGLAYASQRTRPTAPRRRRTRSAVSISKTVEHTVEWGVPVKRTTLTLTDHAQP